MGLNLSKPKRGSRQGIAVVTTTGDVHLDYVQPHLNRELFIIDSLKVAEGVGLTYELVGDQIKVWYDGVCVNDMKSIWLRKPARPDMNKLPFKAAYKKYAFDALEHHSFMLFTALPDTFWVSDQYAIRRASDKTLQGALARKIGFNTPDTIVTSDKQAALSFIKAHKTAIMKPIVHYRLYVDGEPNVMFATKVADNKLPNLNYLYASPAIFQQAIDADCDLRVTVVGGTVFTAKIVTSKLDDTLEYIRDWRVGHFEGEMTVEPFILPKDIQDMCVAHVRRLGLNFGALDLILDKKGVYWFIENNPNGQWGFVERLTGLPIGKAFAGLLLQGKTDAA